MHRNKVLTIVNELKLELIKLRVSKKVSQQEMADRIGVIQSTIAQFELNSIDPRMSTVIRYADALGYELHIELVAKE